MAAGLSIGHRNKKNASPSGGIGLPVNLPWDPEVKSLRGPGTAVGQATPKSSEFEPFGEPLFALEKRATNTTTARPANKITATIGSDISAIVTHFPVWPHRSLGYRPPAPEAFAFPAPAAGGATLHRASLRLPDACIVWAWRFLISKIRGDACSAA